ncbi:MAG: dUTP diphosphatase [Tepidiformaceae bacterium]
MNGVAIVRVKLLRPGARVPVRASASASGFDLHACLEDGPLRLGQHPVAVPTGLAIEVPPGLDAQFRPRSGLARRGVLSTLGTLDADYRGECMVTMYTLAPDIDYEVRHGDRIAQLVITHLATVEILVAGKLTQTARGTAGHGSTGP